MIINDMVLGNLIWAELPPSTSVDFDTSHDAEMFNNNENDINQIKDAQSDSNLINDQSTIDLGSNVNCNDENYKRQGNQIIFKNHFKYKFLNKPNFLNDLDN